MNQQQTEESVAAPVATRSRGQVPGEPHSAGPVDMPRIERAVREILTAVGEDPDREGLL